MNKLLKRGMSAWLIFIKNKVAGAVMMFVSGVMMAISGFNGKGNDTKTLPSVIALFGVAFAFWAFFRLGHIKSDLDREENREKKAVKRRAFYLQIFEAVIYLIITFIGVYLFVNEGFTDKVLNLMAGGFTILNGVFGAIYVYKNRERKNFGWKFRIGLTAVEFAMGLYFIFASDSIDAPGYLILGSITTVAGLIEIAHSITRENIENTVKDSKDIVKAFKDED